MRLFPHNVVGTWVPRKEAARLLAATGQAGEQEKVQHPMNYRIQYHVGQPMGCHSFIHSSSSQAGISCMPILGGIEDIHE